MRRYLNPPPARPLAWLLARAFGVGGGSSNPIDGSAPLGD
jgi:hypothetical protein